MTGSVALDVVIGLVFIYLLYSLLATVICEIVSSYWGFRARNLLYSIERMLEDNPMESENKIIAFFRQIKDSIIRLFETPEGPASCVFYRLPVIKYLAKNTFHSKPSYITKQTFSKALFEIFRIYGGSGAATDLEKVHKVLDGKLEHKGVLKDIRDKINVFTKEGDEKTNDDYAKLFDWILQKIKDNKGKLTVDATQAKLCKKIRKSLKNQNKLDKEEKKELVYQIDEMLNLFGHETRSHMRSLLKDANDDLLKFKLHLEQWFDDTQDRATGWYKQQIQLVLLLIGLVIATFFNANTIDIIHKLSVDKDARDKLVQLTSDYLKDPNSVVPDTSQKVPSESMERKVKTDSLKRIQEKLQKQINDANSLIGAGWPELPNSLSLLVWTQPLENKLAKADSLRYSIIELDTVDQSGKPVKRILTYPNTMTNAILGCLDEAWCWGGERYQGFNKDMTRINVESGFSGTILYMSTTLFSKSFWGFFLTAIAISLGAPFWFDLLNKLMLIRGSVRQPTQTQKSGGTSASTAGTSDPAHPINRKG